MSKMIYKRSPTEVFTYQLKTTPPEAVFWDTYKLQKIHVVLTDKFDRKTAADIKQEILDDIFSTEPNTRATKNKNPIPEGSKITEPHYVEVRKKQQKTRSKSNR